MKTRLLIMDILTFVCIQLYAEDRNFDDSENEYLENLTVCSGVISTSMFNSQEQFWSHSNVMKLLFGYTEYTGISASYKFTEWVSADAVIMPIDGDKMINYRLGVTFIPIEGLHLKFYGGLNDCDEIYKSSTINMAAFLGYKCDKFALGAELNHTMNSSYTFGKDYYGYSIFASLKMAEFVDFYLRFDDIYSKNNWNLYRDEQSAVLGVQFKINENITNAPNFKMIVPKAEELDRSYFAYVNCSINL